MNTANHKEYMQKISQLGDFKKITSKKYRIKDEHRYCLEIYSTTSKEKVNTFEILPCDYNSIREYCISPNEKYIAAVENDNEDYLGSGRIHVWEIESGSKKEFEFLGMNRIGDIMFSTNGKYLTVQHSFPDINIVWDVDTGKIVCRSEMKKCKDGSSDPDSNNYWKMFNC